MSLQIMAAAALQATQGSFGAAVVGDRLSVPTSIAKVLTELKIRTAEDLLSRTRSFPTSVATALGWSVNDVADARVELVALLDGNEFVRQAFLSPAEPPTMSFGARAPSDASVKPGEVNLRSSRSPRGK